MNFSLLATGLILLGLAVVIGCLWALHRICVALEERGYLYYRSKPQSGSATSGALMELDRLTRPSVQYVVETRDAAARIAEDDAAAAGDAER